PPAVASEDPQHARVLLRRAGVAPRRAEGPQDAARPGPRGREARQAGRDEDRRDPPHADRPEGRAARRADRRAASFGRVSGTATYVYHTSAATSCSTATPALTLLAIWGHATNMYALGVVFTWEAGMSTRIGLLLAVHARGCQR